MPHPGSFGSGPSPRGRSTTFGLGPSPRGRSASRHDDDIFGSPRSRSSRSKSRPRLSELGYDPSDPIFRNSSPFHRSSRSRRPSISVAYTRASFATHGTHDDDYLEPTSFSPAPRAPRSPSRYPPSASKSGSLSYSPTGLPVDVRDRNRSRSRRRSSISLGDAPTTGIFPLELSTDELLGYGPDSSSRRPRAASLERQTRDSFKPRSGTTSWPGSGDYASESFAGDAFEPSRISRRPTAPALEPPFRSKFFGSGSSSSGSSPSAPRPLEGDPSITSRRRSRSSGRSKDSSLFGRASGEEDFAFPPPTTSFGRTNTRAAPQIRRTSFVSGFSDQMEYDEHGQEHFRRGTVLYGRYNACKTDNRNATNAIIRYKERKAELPPRKRVISGPDAAIGDSRGLGGNFTIPERESDGY